LKSEEGIVEGRLESWFGNEFGIDYEGGGIPDLLPVWVRPAWMFICAEGWWKCVFFVLWVSWDE